MELPLFPLHSVLCPGVALPLHIFEERYRLMIGRCIDRGEPFGVVLLREGRDGSPLKGRIATVGTTAIISEVGRREDGRLDIMTVGGRRFHIEALDSSSEPYLVGEVGILEEPMGDPTAAKQLARRVSRRFIQYLELLQPAFEQDGENDVEIEIRIEAAGTDDDDDEEAEEVVEVVIEAEALDPVGLEEPSFGSDTREQGLAAAMASASEQERHEFLMAAARRLAVPDDPTMLSYILGGLVQVEMPVRQSLLEAGDTASRLGALDSVLGREIQLLSRRLKPLLVDPKLAHIRRN
jgi:Lon protease-like protein